MTDGSSLTGRSRGDQRSSAPNEDDAYDWHGVVLMHAAIHDAIRPRFAPWTDRSSAASSVGPAEDADPEAAVAWSSKPRPTQSARAAIRPIAPPAPELLDLLFLPVSQPVRYIAIDVDGTPAREFATFAAIAEECASSRLWAGVHFSTANQAGSTLGRAVADRVVGTMLRPAQ